MKKLEKFLSLPIKKQNRIIDAALISFGANGYKKTSISDIASAAGISKPMIFHYFGTKKALYLYLVKLCSDIFIDEMSHKFDENIVDFFERIHLAANIEISAMKKHPFILSFFNSVYFETDDEVFDDIRGFLATGEDFRTKVLFSGMDVSKFKNGIDPKLVMKMLTWFIEGYLSELPRKSSIDIEILCEEFDECLNLFKSNFYKEEEL